MKKIFGILSLIAILTVTFTVSANVTDNNSSVEFVVDMGSPDLTPSVAIVPTVEGVLFKPIFDAPSNFVTNTNADANEVTTIESIDAPSITSDANEVATIEPIEKLSNFEYGLVASIDEAITTTVTEPLPDLNTYVSNYNKHFGSTSLIDDIATNVGKLTKLTYKFKS